MHMLDGLEGYEFKPCLPFSHNYHFFTITIFFTLTICFYIGETLETLVAVKEVREVGVALL